MSHPKQRADKTSEVRPDPFAQARHDLRTPVNQIIGYSELLQEEAEEEGKTEYVPDLQKIQAAARRQLEVITKYLSPQAVAQLTGAADGAVEAPPPEAPEPGPVAPPAAAETPAEASPTDAGAQESVSAASGGALLVVDDNEMNRDMLSRRLSSRKYAVDVAEDGARALEKIAASSFDLVLLDVMMPGISGLDVLRTLRKTYSMADLPVIMATAKDQSEDIVEALKLGANDYVTKPLDFPVVLARVQTQLTLKRQKDEIHRLVENLEVRNRFIRNTFGRYLSDEVVESLLETPEGLKLGGEKKTVTILMSDLRAFTSVSERLGAEQVVRMLNQYLGVMTEIIMGYQGTIDEFIGDAILTIFGAPISRSDDAARAVACAAAMQLAMDGVNQGNEAEGLPRIEMGIAVHTGDVVVGNIGSQRRTKYGIVGPPVNLTGRIESYTVGGQVLISDATLREAGDIVEVGESVQVRAKGAREPITVHELHGIGGEYDVFLPTRQDHLVPVAEAVPVKYFMLEGKQVGEQAVDARLTKLSEKGAEIESDSSLPPLSNIKLEIRDGEKKLVSSELYAKIVEVRGDDGRVLVVRFTAVPPEVEKFFGELRDQADG
jgi:class 3 adenylate cyclase/CheY-like chemotaxis protein